MCQLQQNLSAAQIAENGLSISDRSNIEEMANIAKDGNTNYFQLSEGKLSAPRDPSIEQIMRNEKRIIQLTWQSAYAGDQPIKNYQIWCDNQQLTSIDHYPQTTKKPLSFEDNLNDKAEHTYKIVTVDVTGRSAASESFIIPSIG
jgi:hypothetical protein